MSEEEIILDRIGLLIDLLKKKDIDLIKKFLQDNYYENKFPEAIQDLLDLYQKEKEKNEKLEKQIKLEIEGRDTLVTLCNAEKEKNKELEAKKQIAENTVYSMQNDLMLKNGEEYFVPISKIKAKIEELEELKNEDIKLGMDRPYWLHLGGSIYLQKLLEEK